MRYLAAAILLLASLTTQAGVLGFLSQEQRDWKFIQSVGGMKVSVVDEKSLVIDCDVSGTKTVTVKPTIINSGIGVRGIKHKRDGTNIYLTVVTSVIEKGMSTACKPLDLSRYPTGHYAVLYRNPDGTTQPVGTVTLGPKPSGKIR